MALIITLAVLMFLGSMGLLYQVLKSKDNVYLTINLKKGEMNVKKKKSK
jgi:hypothetical protein